MDGRPLGSTVTYGLLGSLAGGIVSGVMLANWDLMNRLGALAGPDTPTAAWLTHMTFALFFGLFFGLLLARIPWNPVLIGLGWGATIWLFGFMIVLPLALGSGGVLDLTVSTAWLGLAAHLMYGLTAGGVAFAGLRHVHGTQRQAHAG